MENERIKIFQWRNWLLRITPTSFHHFETLLKVIEWSWLWALAPTWGGAILFIIAFIIYFNLSE